MNRGELVSYVIDKVGQTDPEDIASCQKYLSKRYEMIWNQYLWKDSLIGCDVPVDPTNADNAEGIILCPSMIDRVVAVRTPSNAVRIHGMEEYYAIDYDKFTKQGQAYEFALLSPIWFKWRGIVGLQINSQPADNGKQVKITWLNTAGIRFVQTVTLNSAIPTILLGDPNSKNLTISGAGTNALNGLYVFDGGSDPQGNQLGTKFIQQSIAQNWIIYDGVEAWRIIDSNTVTAFYDSFSLITGPWQVDNGNPPAPTVTPTNATITIESFFKGATTGSVSIDPMVTFQQLPGGTLSPSDTASPKYQRIRLVGKPQQNVTLSILGKKKAAALDFDQEEPELRNIDNCLIAFTESDMLQKQRQYGKAQAKMQEAVALLKELASLECVQAANNSHFMPQSGFASEYFGPSLGYEYGL